MEGYNFGRTFSRTFGLIRDGLPTVGIFMLVIQIVSTALNYLLQGQLASFPEDLAIVERFRQ